MVSGSLDLDQILQVLSQSPDFGLEACRNFAQFLIKQVPDYAAAHQLILWCDRKQAAKAEQQSLDSQTINCYRTIVTEEEQLFKALDHVVVESGEPLEGNCFYYHLSLKPSALLENKRINLFSSATQAQKILEIGFNAGHSAALMLLANPNSNLLAFDICEHRYTEGCFAVLAERFPHRIDLIAGDSNTTLPLFRLEHPAVYFDLLHIDGSHSCLPNGNC
nr:class I SAM-dependent methyltransferase [Synechococcus elongatus]